MNARVYCFLQVRAEPLGRVIYLSIDISITLWYYTGGGGYLRVHESVGDLIDWYNVQVSVPPVENFSTQSHWLPVLQSYVSTVSTSTFLYTFLQKEIPNTLPALASWPLRRI